MAVKKPSKSNALYDRLRTHFGVDPAKPPVVHQEFASYERANLHLAPTPIAAAGCWSNTAAA